jgi:hypothetical protein
MTCCGGRRAPPSVAHGGLQQSPERRSGMEVDASVTRGRHATALAVVVRSLGTVDFPRSGRVGGDRAGRPRRPCRVRIENFSEDQRAVPTRGTRRARLVAGCGRSRCGVVDRGNCQWGSLGRRELS